MSGGVVADRFRPPVFVPFPKNKRHTWQLWFARFPILWRSILETTQLPANPGKKTAERRSVVACQNLTVEPATVCVRNQVSTIAQIGGNPSMCSMCLFSHRLRFEIVGISVNHYQPRNLAHVQVGKSAYVVAAKSGSHQNVGPGDAGMMQRRM